MSSGADIYAKDGEPKIDTNVAILKDAISILICSCCLITGKSLEPLV